MLTQNDINLIKHNCKYYQIENYSINDDGSIDVDGDVILSNYNLFYLPLRFNRVTGSFVCSSTNLITLKGAPKYVGQEFAVNANKLKTLEHFPIEVGLRVRYCNSLLPRQLNDMIWALNLNDLLVFIKYYQHYDVFEYSKDDTVLKGGTIVNVNKDNYNLLLQEIKEGLR